MEQGQILYSVSKHAKERYAERIADKEKIVDRDKYIRDHDKDIVDRINKLIHYGNLIYEGFVESYGRQQVYLKDLWVVIADPSKKNVVTLYKIDLGDDEVSKLYIEKCLERINAARVATVEATLERDKEIIDWQNIIDKKTADIKHYKAQIKQLEADVTAFEELIKNTNQQVNAATYQVQVEVERMIGKRYF